MQKELKDILEAKRCAPVGALYDALENIDSRLEKLEALKTPPVEQPKFPFKVRVVRINFFFKVGEELTVLMEDPFSDCWVVEFENKNNVIPKLCCEIIPEEPVKFPVLAHLIGTHRNLSDGTTVTIFANFDEDKYLVGFGNQGYVIDKVKCEFIPNTPTKGMVNSLLSWKKEGSVLTLYAAAQHILGTIHKTKYGHIFHVHSLLVHLGSRELYAIQTQIVYLNKFE